MNIKRLWRLVSVSLAVVLLTTGCIKLEMDITVANDDTVSGTMVFAIAKSITDLAAEDAESSPTSSTQELFPANQDVKSEPFDDGEYVGTTYTFDDLPLEELAPEVGDESALSIKRQGDNLVVSGLLDTGSYEADLESNPLAASLTEGFADLTSIKMSITLPGEIIQTNGKVDGQTITWTSSFGEKLELQAVAASPLAGPINWLLIIGLAVLALGLAGGLGFWFISKNKPKPVAGSKSNKSTTDAKGKKQSKTEVLAAEALALRPWYQKKRFAFPAIGALAFSLFAIALGLLLPAPDSNKSADSESSSEAVQRDKDAKASADGSGEGEAAQETQAAAPAPAQPAPAPPAPKPAAPEPSSKEASAQVAEETETDNQYYAREDAYYFWSNGWYSRSGLINELVNTMGHSYADAEYGVDFQGIDWSTEAFGMAATFIGDYYYSYQGLFNTLIGEGFSAAEAEYGVNSLDWDWYREAYLYAVDLVNQGYLEDEIYNELIGMGFTDDEAFYGSYFAANPE